MLLQNEGVNQKRERHGIQYTRTSLRRGRHEVSRQDILQKRKTWNPVDKTRPLSRGKAGIVRPSSWEVKKEDNHGQTLRALL